MILSNKYFIGPEHVEIKILETELQYYLRIYVDPNLDLKKTY